LPVPVISRLRKGLPPISKPPSAALAVLLVVPGSGAGLAAGMAAGIGAKGFKTGGRGGG
jgi:hypothetical protein